MRKFRVTVHSYTGQKKEILYFILIEADYHAVPRIIGETMAEYYSTCDSYNIKTIKVLTDQLIYNEKLI